MTAAAPTRSAQPADGVLTDRRWPLAVITASCRHQGRRAGTPASGNPSAEARCASGGVAPPSAQYHAPPAAARQATTASPTSAAAPRLSASPAVCERMHHLQINCSPDAASAVTVSSAQSPPIQFVASGLKATSKTKPVQTPIRPASRRIAPSTSPARQGKATIATRRGQKSVASARSQDTSPRKTFASAHKRIARQGGAHAPAAQLVPIVPRTASRAAF